MWLVVGLMVASIDSLSAPARNTGAISGDLLAETCCPVFSPAFPILACAAPQGLPAETEREHQKLITHPAGSISGASIDGVGSPNAPGA